MPECMANEKNQRIRGFHSAIKINSVLGNHFKHNSIRFTSNISLR